MSGFASVAYITVCDDHHLGKTLMKLTRLIAAAALFATPLTLSAQSDSTPAIGFGILGGATIPVGDYGDAAQTGFNVGAFVDFGRRLGPFGIRADVLYHGFGDRDIINPSGSGTNIAFSNKYSMVTGTLNLVFGLPLDVSVVRPYLTGGVGGYYIRNSPRCTSNSTTCALVSSSLNDDNTTKFGLNGGAGIEFGIGSIGAFLESRFHQVFQGSPDLGCVGTANCNRAALQMVPVNLGIRLQF